MRKAVAIPLTLLAVVVLGGGGFYLWSGQSQIVRNHAFGYEAPYVLRGDDPVGTSHLDPVMEASKDDIAAIEAAAAQVVPRLGLSVDYSYVPLLARPYRVASECRADLGKVWLPVLRHRMAKDCEAWAANEKTDVANLLRAFAKQHYTGRCRLALQALRNRHLTADEARDAAWIRTHGLLRLGEVLPHGPGRSAPAASQAFADDASPHLAALAKRIESVVTVKNCRADHVSDLAVPSTYTGPVPRLPQP